MMNAKTIVFIHGLHENAHSWTEWKQYFEDLESIVNSLENNVKSEETVVMV